MITIIIYQEDVRETPEITGLHKRIIDSFSKEGVSPVFSPLDEDILDRIIIHQGKDESKNIACVVPEAIKPQLETYWESRKDSLLSKKVTLITQEKILQHPQSELEYVRQVIESSNPPQKEIR